MPESRRVTEPAPLLEFLFSAWSGQKKKQVRTWLKFRAVHVNGIPVTQFNHQLQAGDTVEIKPGGHGGAKQTLLPGMHIRHEDDAIVVLEKPEGLLSMASETELERTAYFALNAYLRHSHKGKPQRAWIVHRLDRETSGLMVFAKTEESKKILQDCWDQAKKVYLAVVEGRPPAKAGTFHSHLNESLPHRVYSTDKPVAGVREAVTHYRVLSEKNQRTRVELTLETGRRHQIRVHLSDAGCPIVGDEKYGAKTNPAKRLALHASKLSFPHPVTGKKMAFESPFPPELDRLA